ncbi:hypothetical protein OsI_12922 [Oryza sativa Indica Group]|uniref:CCHC-type domain-containing protein n=1 Tax=Oryza sativa subsp. indica TaxID=39946 RepID=B8AP24_ORYSI|nr:hypothetical protein OsI_12922 [Oryza sativa Indica Group]
MAVRRGEILLFKPRQDFRNNQWGGHGGGGAGRRWDGFQNPPNQPPQFQPTRRFHGEGSEGDKGADSKGLQQGQEKQELQYRPVKPKENDQEQKGETEVHTEQQKGDLPNSGSNPAGMVTNQKLVCLRCKEKGHLARDCHARIFCTNCSKPTHKTEDCLYDKQPRPVAKLVGYGAPRLGCILIQNVKSAPPREHMNPMAMVKIIYGEGLTETELEEGFKQQFRWNWEWTAKKQPNGTKVEVNVSEWTSESAAIGKMHVVWVVIEGLPDEMKGYQALFEVGSNLGVVMEVDMPMLAAKDIVRMKVGMMDVKQFPLKLILSTPEALLYEACFNLESVVEMGWLKGQQLDKQQETTLNVEEKEEQKVLTKGKQVEEMKELAQHVVGAQQKGECSQAQRESVHRLVEEDRIKAIQILQDNDDKMVSQEVSTAKGVQRSQLVASSEDDIEEEGEEEGKVHLGESEELFDSQDSENALAKILGVVLPEEELGKSRGGKKSKQKVQR